MARVRIPPLREFPWYIHLFFRMQRRRYGVVLEPARIWARCPRLLLGLSSLYGALDRESSPLDPRLRALVTVRVSQINWCEFCVDLNAALLLDRGGDRMKLKEIAKFEVSPQFTESEKAALAYAEVMTYSDRNPTPADLDRLREHFDEQSVIELTALIAFQNLSSKFNAALDVAPQGFCDAADRPAVSSKT